MPEPSAEGRATGDCPAHLPAECRAQLAVDEAIEDRVLQPQDEAGVALLQCNAVVDGDGGRSVEDVPLARRDRLLLRRVVDLLEDAGDSEHERRPERHEHREQVLDVGSMPEPGACANAAELDHPAEDVGDRQEQEGG